MLGPLKVGLSILFSPADSAGALVAYLVGALLFSVLVLALLHKGLGWRGKRRLTMAVTFLAGLFFALEYFYPVRMVGGRQHNFLTDYIQPATCRAGGGRGLHGRAGDLQSGSGTRTERLATAEGLVQQPRLLHLHVRDVRGHAGRQLH